MDKIILDLKDKEDFYKNLLAYMPEAVVIHSDGKIIYVNQSALKLYGANSFSEMIGVPITQFIHPDSQELIKKRIKKLAQGSTNLPVIEEKFLKKTGEIVIAEVRTTPCIFDGKDAVMSVLRDITERKELEAK